MNFEKTIKKDGEKISLYFKALPDEEEIEIINRYKLYRYRIHEKDGSFSGSRIRSANMIVAFRSQVGKVKNRWSAALNRTSGFVILDVLYSVTITIFQIFKAFVRLIFGTRTRLKDLIEGREISSRKPEKIREAEFFILISIAAITKCIDYLKNLDFDKFYSEGEVFLELDGLDFAGSGTLVENEFEELKKTIASINHASDPKS